MNVDWMVESNEGMMSRNHSQWQMSRESDVNETESPQELEEPSLRGRDEDLAKIEITVLAVIFLMSVIGNVLMLMALRKQLRHHPMSRMYFFMMNLSIADLLVGFGNILPQLAWDITFRFQGNDFLCKTVKFLQVFVLYLSTYILTSMTLDRYLVICRSTLSRMYYGGLRGPKTFIIVSWIVSAVLACPQAVIFKMHELPNGEEDCWVTFIEPWGAKAYVTWFVTVVMVIPLAVISTSYAAILCHVYKLSVREPKQKKTVAPSTLSPTVPPGEFQSIMRIQVQYCTDLETTDSQDGTSPRINGNRLLQHSVNKAKMKALKLTLVVVSCFFACWAPFCVTQLIMVYNPKQEAGDDASSTQVILLLLASLNSCVNPWIYLMFSKSLRDELTECLGCPIIGGEYEDSIGDEPDRDSRERSRSDERNRRESVLVLQNDKPNEPMPPHSSFELNRFNDGPFFKNAETKSFYI